MSTQELQQRTAINVQEKANLIWAIADKLVGTYKQVADKSLKKQAKASDPKMFAEGIFPKEFNKVAINCFKEQHDSFKKLFEDKEFYNRVCQEMAKAMYLNLKGSE